MRRSNRESAADKQRFCPAQSGIAAEGKESWKRLPGASLAGNVAVAVGGPVGRLRRGPYVWPSTYRRFYEKGRSADTPAPRSSVSRWPHAATLTARLRLGSVQSWSWALYLWEEKGARMSP